MSESVPYRSFRDVMKWVKQSMARGGGNWTVCATNTPGQKQFGLVAGAANAVRVPEGIILTLGFDREKLLAVRETIDQTPRRRGRGESHDRHGARRETRGAEREDRERGSKRAVPLRERQEVREMPRCGVVMRTCDAAVAVLRESNNPAVMWGDEGLCHMIADRAQLRSSGRAWKTSDCVLSNLARCHDGLIAGKTTCHGRRAVRIFWLPEHAPKWAIERAQEEHEDDDAQE